MQPFLAFRRRIDERGELDGRILLLQGGERPLRRGSVFRGFDQAISRAVAIKAITSPR